MTHGAVFISFASPSKERAVWLATQLRAASFEVLIEDDFGAESPRREMARAIERCQVVVALVTPGYPDSMGGQRELDLAEAHLKPVVAVFAGLPSRHPRAAQYAAYRRIELTEMWRGTSNQWTALLDLLIRVLAEQDRRRPAESALDRQSALALERAYLLYDVEDRALAFKLLRARTGWQALSDQQATDSGLARVLLWTRASAERHSLAAHDLEEAPHGVSVFLLRTTDAPTPPPGMLAIPVDRIIGTTRRTTSAVAWTAETAPDEVGRLLEHARAKNHGVPFNVFTERFCGSYEAAGAAEDAYVLAARWLPTGDVLRLRAVYEHALALRFYGDWRDAVEVVSNEIHATPDDLPEDAAAQHLRLRLEHLNVEYELGDFQANGVDRQVKELQRCFRELTDLHGYVQAGRVLGNVLREQGDFDGAERVFQRTIGVAEYLAEHSHEGDPGELLLADCHRELAGLHIARHDDARASACLTDARDLLAEVDPANPAGQYLSAVLGYVDATLTRSDNVLVKATTPTEQAQTALATLARFGNPIRTAAVYDWLGQAWARQLPQRLDDLTRGEEYLRKALRIREERGHSYACGLSHLSLAKLYEVIDDLGGEIRHGEMSREIFEERGVQPGLAKAHAALARAYWRKGLAGDEDARRRFQDHLAKAESLYRDIQLEGEGIELRYELEHGGRQPVDEVSDDTPLIAVGEYLLHRWIREHISALSPVADEQFGLRVGIGDDAAVLTPKGVEPGHSLVFTTDSAPGSLSRLDRSPEYAGKFAVVQTVADIIAMGARPVGLLVNIFLSRAATVGYVKRLVDAVAREALRYGVPVIGGDMKERDEQSVGCVGIGCVPNGSILTRNAAKPGHAVGITLATHPSGTGTRLIGARWAQELVENYQMNNPAVLRNFPALADIVDSNIKDDLLCAPMNVMASAVSTGCLRAAMDTSDGVLACLEIMGRDSNVGFELDEGAIDAIIDDRARHLAERLELPPVAFLFSAGHDWEIVFTCAHEDFPAVDAAVTRHLAGNGRVARLGTVVQRRVDSDMGVQLSRVDGTSSLVQYYTDEKFVPRSYQDRPGQWLGFANRVRSAGDHY